MGEEEEGAAEEEDRIRGGAAGVFLKKPRYYNCVKTGFEWNKYN